nr:virulence-associated E family protein [Mesorhizobium sp.]
MSANASPVEGDTAEAVDFLNRMLPGRQRDLVAIDRTGRISARSFSPLEIAEMRAWIDARQGLSNIYFHVNGMREGFANQKATKENVAIAYRAHVDVDDVGAEDRIMAFDPPPTVVIFSGGGFQAHWNFDKPNEDLAQVEAINTAVAKGLGGDKCQNIDRLMRVSGTINIPNAKKLKAGRVPALAHIVSANWTRTYSPADFQHLLVKTQIGSGPAKVSDAEVRPIGIDELPVAVLTAMRSIIELGDDLERPRGGPDARFPSRSEAVYRVSCELARAGCSEDVIAGVLINPSLGISRSILEKKRPNAYARRQARAGTMAVITGWPDCNAEGAPKPTLRNTAIALRRLGFTFSHDLFRHRKMINGNLLDEHEGEISDDACALLRSFITDTFNFDPRAENVRDAVTQLCLERTFHPIRQMLDALEWDGVPRIDNWLSTYMGAEDTELNRAIGRIMLIAAVRRVREPGVKFDTIVILEGKQGTGKSTALQILAGPDNHSDNEILALDTKAQMEAMEGVWIYELSEMSGLNRSEAAKTKAFASRQHDRARMSYGRFSERRGRQAIFVGTTNEQRYLKDRTGNRRFLPVRTGEIDLDALRRDRDQLWAEAAKRGTEGASIVLPQELWAAAAAEQAERLEYDAWEEALAAVQGKAYGNEVRVFTSYLLGTVLEIPAERQHGGAVKRVADLMQQLGWEQGKFKIGKKTIRGFRRAKPEEHVDDDVPRGDFPSF